MKFQSIKKLVMLALIVTAFVSCNNGPTLQTYYVDNELKPGFTTFDVPTGFIDVDKVELSDQQEKAYKSIDKLNVLAFKVDEKNGDVYKTELENVKTILKNPKYEELMRGGNTTDGKFVVKFLGDIENIDELIILGNANDKGFMVARILGDDMNANDLMSLRTIMNDVKFEDTDLNGLTDFFK
ncbi:hypothetical protein BTO05_04110 [Winogradskyella sp. PC-19]|uniref:DUF4252 domain-containing protein n=1 Tax=unclassified Winogradskyella TaxID=2615021 RepID=UPI000B3C0F46|nr:MULTISPECIES: DUF4252 domain-containing protein [unclassified Winogradskyella]ARV08861.1 hypothetical protein BTO05_04110 [Winogradskyella sp. PC-19]RZN79920.1 MAG: DUF4252 domain-containing protein [Winogradskyella sp.]